MAEFTVEGAQATIKEKRVKIDALIQEVINDLQKSPANQLAPRNLQLSINALEDAKMRLGKCLEDMGSELPAQFADKSTAQK